MRCIANEFTVHYLWLQIMHSRPLILYLLQLIQWLSLQRVLWPSRLINGLPNILIVKWSSFLGYSASQSVLHQFKFSFEWSTIWFCWLSLHLKFSWAPYNKIFGLPFLIHFHQYWFWKPFFTDHGQEGFIRDQHNCSWVWGLLTAIYLKSSLLLAASSDVLLFSWS